MLTRYWIDPVISNMAETDCSNMEILAEEKHAGSQQIGLNDGF